MKASKKDEPRATKRVAKDSTRGSAPHGRYSKVLRRMWNDERFRRLSAPPPNAQTLWQRLLTGPELGVVPGLFQAWDVALAKALGWPLEAFAEAFLEIAREGLAKADWDVGLVWIPNAIVHNRPESPNVVRSWRSALGDLPECELKQEAIQRLRDFGETLGKGFSEAFEEALPKPTWKPSRKTSPNQNTDTDTEDPPLAPGPGAPPDDDRGRPSGTHPVAASGTNGTTGAHQRPKNIRRLESPSLVAEYERAVASVTGHAYVVPRMQAAVLDDAVDAHGPSRDIAVITPWLREVVGVFAAQVDDDARKYRGGYDPKGFTRWLNDGGLAKATNGNSVSEYPEFEDDSHAGRTSREDAIRFADEAMRAFAKGNGQ